MIKSYTNECIKLIKHPFSIWSTVIFLVFVIYTYLSVGSNFQNSFQAFMDNSGYSVEQTYQFISGSDPSSSSLSAMLFILSSKMAIAYSLASVNALGPIVISIIGALIFGIEYRSFTLRQLWVQGLTRLEVLLTKVMAIFTFILLFMLMTILVGIMFSFVTPVVFNLPMDLVNSKIITIKDYSPQILGSIISLLLWGMFAGCITVLSKSLMAGIIVGFIYPTIESSVFHSWSVGQYLPLFIQKSMLPILFRDTAYGGIVSFYDMPDIYSVTTSMLFTLAYTMFFLLVTWIALKKQRTLMP
ncbi:ABC-2 transporter permease [Paenibacillus xylanivorans]|uniref:Uncharacterized protein n=1 Tax=Paenibacillus xylanivorans TaxID=1705561 RepID=A0A0M9BQX0_9BACL|nr:ABC transporter permease subunit [Paenibacillus xylanivorans]KOY17248.1 hypothetical protein AMS66_06860 [Paenibacillus xylanivorans]